MSALDDDGSQREITIGGAAVAAVSAGKEIVCICSTVIMEKRKTRVCVRERENRQTDKDIHANKHTSTQTEIS